MMIVLFRSRLSPEAGADYRAMAEEMETTARGMPGFVDFKTYSAADGDRISIVVWKDQETMRAWREHPRHAMAQAEGRKRWYDYYRVDVTEVIRSSEFQRETSAAPSER